MAFLLFALPLLNCVTPAQAMTTAEKECCKKRNAVRRWLPNATEREWHNLIPAVNPTGPTIPGHP
jgi:hypothetical protein